jgi:pimeloyl-ACP methyl ester carboxylesterase
MIIHGSSSDYRSFSRAAAVLADKGTVVRVSLRLHWPNPWPPSEQEVYDTYKIEIQAADVAALIESWGHSPIDVVGHSYGGVVAVQLAQARPDLVRRLALVEPALRGILRTSPEGERFIQNAMAARDEILGRIRAGEEPLAAGSTSSVRVPSIPLLRRDARSSSTTPA